MLAQLLGCGGHLPVLSLALGWAPPTAWARLRSARRGFRAALGDDELRVLAAGLPRHGATVLEVVGAAVGCGPWDACSGLKGKGEYEELARCESALVAVLQGADINEEQLCTAVTPLMRAAEESRWRLCHLLLSQGADANRISIGGATALSLALDASCGRCQALAGPGPCGCPRPAVARLLLRRTRLGLAEAFGAAVRMALQDKEYLPVMEAMVTERGLPVDLQLRGPDGRFGTALSAALERRVMPVEAPLAHRSLVVSRLLELRADPARPGPYVAWCGGAPAPSLLPFAVANGCDLVTLQLLGAV